MSSDRTVYVEENDPARVAGALSALLAREGLAPVDAPSAAFRFAVFAGAPGWTVVKCAPADVLEHEERLPKLARELAVGLFEYDLHDGQTDLIYEVDAGGEVAISGYDPTSPPWDARDPDLAPFGPVRLQRLDVRAAIESARGAPTIHGAHAAPSRDLPREALKLVSQTQMELLAWLRQSGSTIAATDDGGLSFDVPPSAIVESVVDDTLPSSVPARAVAAAIRHVFGGERHAACTGDGAFDGACDAIVLRFDRS